MNLPGTSSTSTVLEMVAASLYFGNDAILLSMTHGLAGLQALMLIGRTPGPTVWISLGLISIVVYGALYLILRQNFRKVVG